jgi:hypothetical protein
LSCDKREKTFHSKFSDVDFFGIGGADGRHDVDEGFETAIIGHCDTLFFAPKGHHAPEMG